MVSLIPRMVHTSKYTAGTLSSWWSPPPPGRSSPPDGRIYLIQGTRRFDKTAHIVPVPPCAFLMARRVSSAIGFVLKLPKSLEWETSRGSLCLSFDAGDVQLKPGEQNRWNRRRMSLQSGNLAFEQDRTFETPQIKTGLVKHKEGPGFISLLCNHPSNLDKRRKGKRKKEENFYFRHFTSRPRPRTEALSWRKKWLSGWSCRDPSPNILAFWQE